MGLLATVLSLPSLIGTAARSTVSLPHRDVDAEQQVPLRPFHIGSASSSSSSLSSTTPSDPPPTPKPFPRSPSPPLPSSTTLFPPYFKRLSTLLLSLFAIYQLFLYLYSDPERWEPTWKEVLYGPSKIVFPSLVPAAGRQYQGESDGPKVLAWRGIRYAEPPVEELRFRRAIPLLPPYEEGEVVNATRYGDGCARPNRDGEGYTGVEDCLTLNIHSLRKRKPGVLLPVMVWIHGGGFATGSSSEARYNPRDLLERSHRMNQPFIFVSLNYRLQVLGFSAAAPEPGPPPEAPHIPVGPPSELDLNVGLKDQLLAMEWVHNEIFNWGGDPDKVTLVGHSAGAISIGLHQLYSPPELFRGAFMLSGAPTSFPVPFPHDAAARTIYPLVDSTGCPGPVSRPNGGPPSSTALLDCLRSLPLADLMEGAQYLFDLTPINGYFPWYPVLEGEWEGTWLDIRPSDRIVRGTFSKVPVVMGGVRDEGTRFTSPDIESEDDVKEVIHWAFEFTFGAIQTILEPLWKLYPDNPTVGSPYQTGNETFGLHPSYKRAASILGDFFFQAPRRHFLRETPKDFGEPSWNYLYDEAKPGSVERLGAQHGADVSSWFGHSESVDPELHHLSRHMSAYLINFIANLDPNGPGLRAWPHYGMDRRTLHLGRHNITITHDNARLEAMHFINDNNPLFAR